MADVFISYAREDRARAELVARHLSDDKLDVFWDTDIPPGQTWADYIEGKLAACRAVIVLWSEHSTKSQWVREEARMGRDKSKLIPAMIDSAPAPFGFGEVQAANLANWNGDANDPEWQRFRNAVRTAVGAPASAAPPPPPRQAYTPPPVAAPNANASSDSSPIGYIKKCLRLYFDGSGRARRAEYGWFMLALFIAAFIAVALDMLLFGYDPYTSTPLMYLFSYGILALLPPAVSAGSRRAHDFGQSGWLAALTVIPYLGWIAVLAFIFIPGQPGENKYGPDPKR